MDIDFTTSPYNSTDYYDMTSPSYTTMMNDLNYTIATTSDPECVNITQNLSDMYNTPSFEYFL